MEKHSLKKRMLPRKVAVKTVSNRWHLPGGTHNCLGSIPHPADSQKSNLTKVLEMIMFYQYWFTINKAHERLRYKPRNLRIHFQFKVCRQTTWTVAPPSMTNAFTFLWSTDASWNPRQRHHTGRLKSKPNEQQTVAWACQSNCNPDASGSGILSPDKCPPLSSTTTILIQAAITLSLDKHEMLLAVFPASASSFPIHCPQSVQSKHLKIENRPWLSPSSTPLMLCLSLTEAPESRLSSLALAPLTPPAYSVHTALSPSHFSHTQLLLSWMHRPLSTSEILHASFPLPGN